jgi:type 2 lantibiotic biosynthesis protein LanM
MLETETKEKAKEAAWYQATTLAERVAASSKKPTTANSNLAAQRLARWRSQSPLNDEAVFAQSLALDGLTETQLLELLGESPNDLMNRFAGINLEWVEFIKTVLALPLTTESEEDSVLPTPKYLISPRLVGFLNVLRPFIVAERRRLRAALLVISQTHPQLPTTAAMENLILEGLAGQLIDKLSPVLVLELNIARMQGQLQGETPETRFESYTQTLAQPEAPARLLKEYPVMARQVTTALRHWIDFKLDFMRQLGADWAELGQLFNAGASLGQLIELDSNLGDGHRGGKMVLMAKFSSGVQLVYKPRSLGADLHFQELLNWVNARGSHPAFRTLHILSKAEHGWVEFIKVGGCTSVDEIQRFYRRQGGYLALLYMLGATDFHHQNLIASGEHPFLIDLEALFHPFLATATTPTTEPGQSNKSAGTAIAYSVLGVGLLPSRVKTHKGEANVEVSGLGGKEGQLTLYPQPYWENPGTDQMHLAHKRLEMVVSQNRPTLNGANVNSLDYAEAITQGFTEIYKLLVEHRAELLASTGPLNSFREDEVRVVLRATQTYELLIRHNSQPDKLRDAMSREPLFNKLWLEVKRNPTLARAILAERQDLAEGDIPIFTTRPASPHLWTSRGEVITDFLREPGLVAVQERLQKMDQSDLSRQLWFINASLTVFSTNPEHDHTSPARPLHLPLTLLEPTKIDPAPLLKAALAIGARLEELALPSQDSVNWIGLNLERFDQWSLTPLNLNIYDGLPGVALFLAYLGRCADEPRYTKLAQATLTSIREQIKLSKTSVSSVGSMEGWGSVLYTLTHLSALWQDPTLLDEAQALALEVIPPLLEKDIFLDVITGAAGCIGVLVGLYQQHPTPQVLELAVKCGEHLLAQAQPQAQGGIAWRTFMPVSQAATGFGRGSTGMGWALLKLASISGEQRFQEAGLAALDYERHVFSATESNWPDYRTAGKAKLAKGELRFMTAWCHGAPGIGLARLSLLPELAAVEDPAIVRAEVEAAIKNTLEQGFGFNHSLCHGDLGNLDFVLEASQVFKDPALETKVAYLSASILADIAERGWICSTPMDVETPGLLVGLAGIGYGLLRVAAPSIVPSVLVLAGPKL